MQTLFSIMKLPQTSKSRLLHCALAIIGCVFAGCFFTGCSEDTSYPSVTTSFVDAITDSKGMVASIRTDNGNVYEPDLRTQTNSADSVIRCLCTYETMQQDMPGNSTTAVHPAIHVYSLKHVFSEKPQKRSAFSIYPQDPVKVTSVWKGGGYINMHLGILTTNVAAHSFAFCEDSIITSRTGKTSVYLSLLHLRPEQDPESYTEKAYISMPIHKYLDMDTIVFHINSYESRKEFVYSK